MDSSLSSNQGSLTSASETSSSAFLLERGIRYTQQGCYAEGVIYFARARERLSPDQMHFAVVLDAFIQSYARYLQAQQALHMASKRFVEADAEQQTQLVALEKLLPALKEDTDRVPQPHTIAKAPKVSWGYQSPQSLQLPSTDPTIEQPSLLPHSLLKDGDALPALYFTCFGHFEVKRLGESVSLCQNRNGQVVLRYLVTQPGYRATMDMLMAVLWPEDEPEVARHKVQVATSALRRSLNHGYAPDPGGGYILCKNGVYELNPAVSLRSDVDEFLLLYQTGRQSGGDEAAILYERACQLYTGPFLVEDLYADWSFPRREQLGQYFLIMCSALAEHYLGIGRYEDTAKWASAILKENRCDEEAHRQLMRAYTARGRRSEALRQYQRCEQALLHELGVAPMPETVSLFETILVCKQNPHLEKENSSFAKRK